MRILGFSKKWEKLSQPEFTTFRFPRRDRDWEIGEVVQVYYKNRTPQREKLGEAEIIQKKLKLTGDATSDITDSEAQADGFSDVRDMENWIMKAHGIRAIFRPINKLTLKRLRQELKV